MPRPLRRYLGADADIPQLFRTPIQRAVLTKPHAPWSPRRPPRSPTRRWDRPKSLQDPQIRLHITLSHPPACLLPAAALFLHRKTLSLYLRGPIPGRDAVITSAHGHNSLPFSFTVPPDSSFLTAKSASSRPALQHVDLGRFCARTAAPRLVSRATQISPYGPRQPWQGRYGNTRHKHGGPSDTGNSRYITRRTPLIALSRRAVLGSSAEPSAANHHVPRGSAGLPPSVSISVGVCWLGERHRPSPLGRRKLSGRCGVEASVSLWPRAPCLLGSVC